MKTPCKDSIGCRWDPYERATRLCTRSCHHSSYAPTAFGSRFYDLGLDAQHDVCTGQAACMTARTSEIGCSSQSSALALYQNPNLHPDPGLCVRHAASRVYNYSKD